MKAYNKLIRDKIPEIIRKDHKEAEVIQLDELAFLEALKVKLIEEAQEIKAAQDRETILSELADLQEVMDYIKQHYAIDQMEINTQQALKAFSRGKFDQRLFLKWVSSKDDVHE
jgi:predicted house-cleaning noncanonical NTP pyrophosphatase (MazG superfamily)